LALKGVEMMALSCAISHFLNCLLSSCQSPHSPYGDEDLQTRHAKKRRNRSRKYAGDGPAPGSVGAGVGNGNGTTDWVNLTPKALWQQIKADVKASYAFDLEADGVDSAVETYSFPKISLLR
jgi:protein TIF31